MVDNVESTPARRAASPSAAVCNTRKRRGRPCAIDSQAAKQARKHTGSLGFLPAKDASKTTGQLDEQQSDTVETPSQHIGTSPLKSLASCLFLTSCYCSMPCLHEAQRWKPSDLRCLWECSPFSCASIRLASSIAVSTANESHSNQVSSAGSGCHRGHH